MQSLLRRSVHLLRVCHCESDNFTKCVILWIVSIFCWIFDRDHPDPHKVSPCIPLDLVNKAFEVAREGSGLKPAYPGQQISERDHDYVDILGNVLTETTALIAKELHLHEEKIHHDLPQLDTSQTDIGKFCPAQFRPKICEVWSTVWLLQYWHYYNNSDFRVTGRTVCKEILFSRTLDTGQSQVIATISTIQIGVQPWRHSFTWYHRII